MKILQRSLSALMAAAVLAACAPQTADVALPLTLPEAFSVSGAGKVPDRWWRVFNDHHLNRLVDRALAANFDLAVAWQRLREAQAIAAGQSSPLYPELAGFLEAEHLAMQSGEEDRRLSLGLTATYEIDLWGRIRSVAEAERLRARASYADYQTAALSLAAEVVRTWFQLTEAWNQLELLKAQIDTNAKVLSAIENRFELGLTRSVDILRQRQLLEATREQSVAVESRIQVLKHRLAVLLGRPPRQAVAPSIRREMPALTPLPATGLPTELIRRRPDVRSAYHDLEAADQDLAAAISNRYPRLTLTASLLTSEDNAHDLFDGWAHSLAGNLLAPLFDAGRRSAAVDRGAAVRNQRLYAYGRAVLTALQEVEDALIQEEKQLERIRRIQDQVGLARQAYERLQSEYFNGVGNYIEVLTALTDEQQLRRDLLAARIVLLELRIGLYRALAGGFETRRETAPEGSSNG